MYETPIFLWVTLYNKTRDGGYFVPPEFANELVSKGLASMEPDGTFVLSD